MCLIHLELENLHFKIIEVTLVDLKNFFCVQYYTHEYL